MLYIYNIKLEINNKVKKMNEKYKYGLALGLLILMGTMLLSVLWNNLDPMVITISITVGIVLVASSILRFVRNKDLPEKDERTIKISNTALSYSWLITLIFISIIFWVDYLNIYELTVAQVIGAVYFVMIAVAMVFMGYFKNKGDVK